MKTSSPLIGVAALVGVALVVARLSRPASESASPTSESSILRSETLNFQSRGLRVWSGPVDLSSGAVPPSPETQRLDAQAKRLSDAAEAARRQGDVDGAYHLYLRSFDLVDNPLLRLDMIGMLDRAGRTTLALKEYDALFDNPRLGGSYETNPTVVDRYAALCEAAGRTGEAMDLYRGLIAKYNMDGVPDAALIPRRDARDLPSLKATAKIMEGMEHAGHGADKEALACFQAAARLKPDFALAHADVGLGLKNLNRYPEAEVALRKAYNLADAPLRAALGNQAREVVGRIEAERKLRLKDSGALGP